LWQTTASVRGVGRKRWRRRVTGAARDPDERRE
jgi:ribosomal protein L4